MPVPRSVIVSRGMRGICQNGNFSKRDFTGYTDCVSDTPCPGGSLFFSTDCAGSTNCVSVFVPNGRGVFCLYQAGELRSAERGRLPRPRLGQRGRDTCGFPSSLNSYLSLEDSTAKIGEAGPLRKGERQSGYHSVSFVKYLQFADSVLLHMSATLRRARHNRVAQFLGTLYRKVPANLSVWHNLSSWVLSVISKLTNCATLSSPRGPSLALRAIHLVSRLRRVADMCSSRVTEL